MISKAPCNQNTLKITRTCTSLILPWVIQPALLIKIIRAISKSDNGAARVRFEITKSGSPGYVMYVRDESSEQILARPENH